MKRSTTQIVRITLGVSLICLIFFAARPGFTAEALSFALAQTQLTTPVLQADRFAATTDLGDTDLTLEELAAEGHNDDILLPLLEEQMLTSLRSVEADQAPTVQLQPRALQSTAEIGEWSPIEAWPAHATHAALLPDKTIISWDRFSRKVDVYDIENDTHSFTANGNDNMGTNLFCTGFSHFPDGRVMLIGGSPETTATLIYDPSTARFETASEPQMKRYYASVATLGTGELMVFGGNSSNADYPEIYNSESGWRALTNATESISHGHYHWVQQAPNGKVFYAGPMTDVFYLDTEGTGTWEEIARRDSVYRSYGSYAYYDVGKILVTGGVRNGSANATAYTLEINADNDDVEINQVDSMFHQRRQSMMVVLADGQVLVLAGNTSGDFVDIPNGVLPAEIWNPETGKWTEVDAIGRTRQYHASSLLLPDGRVYAGGGGSCAGCSSDPDVDAEFFSPPYLFNADGSLADRPTISSGPSALPHGASFTIQTPDAASIDKIHLIKLGSSTHSQDMSQRLIPLSFSVSGNALQTAVPSNPNVAVPGHYMLFIIDDQGVPSEAIIMNIGGNASLSLNTPGNQETYAGQTVSLPLSAFNPDNLTLTFEAENLPDGLSIDEESGLISGTPTTEESVSVRTSVSGGTQSDSATFTWTITIPDGPINNDPLFTLIDDQATFEGVPVDLQIEASDPDGDPLTFAAEGLPDGLSIDPDTGRITGISSKVDVFFPILTATDDKDGETRIQFNWTIKAAPIEIEPIVTSPTEVGATVAYRINVIDEIDVEYKWNFSDASGSTSWSTDPSISHQFADSGRYNVTVTVRNSAGNLTTYQFLQVVYDQHTAQQPITSSGLVYEALAAADRVWNVNPDNNSVTVFDVDRQIKLAEIEVDQNPRSLAIGPERFVWVVNKKSATISLINPYFFQVQKRIELPYNSQPHGLVIDAAGAFAYVTLEASGELIKIDTTSQAIVGRLAVGAYPRHMTLAADGETLYLSRYITPPVPGEGGVSPAVNGKGGEVLVINVDSMTLQNSILLRHSDEVDTAHSGRGIPNYLGPVVISPGGLSAYIPSKQDNILRGSARDGAPLDSENTVRSISSYISLETGFEVYKYRIDHDNAALPVSATFDRTGSYLFVVMEGTQEVRIVDPFSQNDIGTITVGNAPRNITVSPDNRTLFVHNYLDRSVSLIDISRLITGDKVDIGELFIYNTVSDDVLSDELLRGKQLFHDGANPKLGFSPYLTCASCHSDGGHDGRTWDFTSLGEGLRNTIPLNGRGGVDHGLLHWSGNFDEIQDFENQIRELNQGTGLMQDGDFALHADPLGDPKAGLSADLDAMAAYVNSLDSYDPNPNLNPDGTMNADALAGKSIFESIGCSSCHSGENFTDSGSGAGGLHDIGTLKTSSGLRLGQPLPGIDTPTLLDVWSTGPYLHDGSAATLADAILAHDDVEVSGADLDRLVTYLMQIDGLEEPPPTPTPSPTPVQPATPTPTPVPNVETPTPTTTPQPGATPVPSIEPPVGQNCAIEGSGGGCLYLPLVWR